MGSRPFADILDTVPKYGSRASTELYRALPLLSSDLLTTKVNVSRSFVRASQEGKSAIAFTISVNPGNGKEGWRVNKTYPDILGLDGRIRSSVGKGIGKRIVNLPGGKFWKDQAPAKVDERKAVLGHYLQSLVDLPLKSNVEVIAFLTSDVMRSTGSPAVKAGHKQGYLTKRGKNLGGWKTRYFILLGPVMEYYESQTGANLGSIVITGAQIGRQQPGEGDTYRHALLIIEARKGTRASNRRHVLCADSDEERDAWVDALMHFVTGAYYDPKYALPSLADVKYSIGFDSRRSGASSSDTLSTPNTQLTFHGVAESDISASEGATTLPRLPEDTYNVKSFQTPMNAEKCHSSFSAIKCTDVSPAKQTIPPTLIWGESEIEESNDFPEQDLSGSMVLKLLDDVLQHEAKKDALRDLKGPNAQLLIDYLDWISLQPVARQHSAHKERIKALYRLSKSSQLYPRQYVLSGITKVPVAHGAGGLCDAFPGKYQGQDICLKVVRVYSNKDTSAAMRIIAKEAILWGQLWHPNILPFYGVYYIEMDSAPRACLVSPWMNNGNLINYLASHPNAHRETLVYDVARGLDYLHREELVHGDLKGANILVSDTGTACITDFGLSSIAADDSLVATLSTTTVNRVTFRWVAPEVLEGSERGRASDVWALGCVFYEILTRRLPFHEYKSDATVLGKIIRGVIPTRPVEGKAGILDLIDDQTWDLMTRCWKFEPEGRPTCQQILVDLKVPPYRVQSNPETWSTTNDSTKFQLAMREKEAADVTHLDLQRVEEILKKL